MTSTAARRWRAALESWRLPDRLQARVGDQTYRSPPALWRRARLADGRDGPGETRRVVEAHLAGAGTLLDVGAGTGRLSLPIAAAGGHPVTAVEPDPGMAEGLRAEARELGIRPTLIEGEWPAEAGTAGSHDVVLCANVVYDIAQIARFLESLHLAARRAVVVELTPTHPWTHLAPYYLALHGHRLPEEPTAELFEEVVGEVLDVRTHRIDWMRAGVHRFADLQELVAYYGRRLLVPAERAEDLMRLLMPDVRQQHGWLVLGDPVRPSVTLWWEGAGGGG